MTIEHPDQAFVLGTQFEVVTDARSSMIENGQNGHGMALWPSDLNFVLNLQILDLFLDLLLKVLTHLTQKKSVKSF